MKASERKNEKLKRPKSSLHHSKNLESRLVTRQWSAFIVNRFYRKRFDASRFLPVSIGSRLEGVGGLKLLHDCPSQSLLLLLTCQCSCKHGRPKLPCGIELKRKWEKVKVGESESFAWSSVSSPLLAIAAAILGGMWLWYWASDSESESTWK